MTLDRVGVDLRHRTVSAFVLVTLSICAGLAGGALFAAIVSSVFMLALFEWFMLVKQDEQRWLFWCAVSSALVLSALSLRGEATGLALAGFLGSASLFCAGLAYKKTRWGMIGLSYMTLALCGIFHLRLDAEAGLAAVSFVAFIVWGTDTFAYFSGRLIGGPALSPQISPKKTWAGAIGGTLLGACMGLAILYLQVATISIGLVLLAIALSMISQVGDLAESWVKRKYAVKDTSSLIPGHGGLLDRIDGLLAAIIAAYAVGLIMGGYEQPAQGLVNL